VLAAVLLVLTAPLILLAALLVKLTSRGPAFYCQKRLGRHGRIFTLYKIRTMRHNCEQVSGPRWATRDDPRVTGVGRLLRRTHVDELPQLWNVLRGDMSLVGPRPERPEITPHLDRSIPHYRDRLLVRPGIAGLAQVQLPADTDLESVRRKLTYDLYYINNISLWLDLRIVVGTALYLFGVRIQWLPRLRVVPSRKTIERAYQTVTARGKPAPALPPPAPSRLAPSVPAEIVPGQPVPSFGETT
jgi:lipopolysaccharide/colanic/teichoic acid biosynthesis glycosyltransferase